MAVVGHPEPRLGTAPSRPLTPETSRGFALIKFAAALGVTLLPWQRTAVIRALELREDGTYRFRTILILVGRQQGKTTLLKVWALWRMVEDNAAMVLGAAQNLDIAREAWQGSVDLMEEMRPAAVQKVRQTNGEQSLTLVGGSRYRISASSRGAGRGLSVDFLILDELREQRDWLAWAALSKTTMARPNAQIVAISNAGDDESVVLNSLRDAGLADRDESLCLLEWSAPDGCALDDPEMWAYSCPALGHTTTEEAIRAALATDPAPQFRTELLCQHVSALNPAVDPSGWAHGADPLGSIAPYRDRLNLGIDLAPDGKHVALVAAAVMPGGRVRVEPLASWSDTNAARQELPDLLAKIKPLSLAWFPDGPSNALAPMLRALPFAVELRSTKVTAACMGFADLVQAGRVEHNANQLLDSQVTTAGRVNLGDGFKFSRKGSGNCNALFAAAGAVYLSSVAAAKPERAKIFVL